MTSCPIRVTIACSERAAGGGLEFRIGVAAFGTRARSLRGLSRGFRRGRRASRTAIKSAAGHRPSAAKQQDPVPDARTTGQAPCIEETGDYETHGKTVSYVIGIENKCDKRLKCEIFANVTGAKGSSLGPTTLILGAKSSGAAAKKSYTMKVKAAGGTAQVSRECRVF